MTVALIGTIWDYGCVLHRKEPSIIQLAGGKNELGELSIIDDEPSEVHLIGWWEPGNSCLAQPLPNYRLRGVKDGPGGY